MGNGVEGDREMGLGIGNLDGRIEIGIWVDED